MSGDAEMPMQEKQEGDAAALARTRIMALGGCAFLNGLAFSGLLTWLPIHATKTLGMSAAGYSRVLSLRMGGIVVGAIVLGAVSDRLGAKRVSMACLCVAGAACALIVVAPMWLFLVLVPVVSGLMSASFVNINQMTQRVGNNKQGLANTVYRATGTAAGMIGPLVATYWIDWEKWVLPGLGLGVFAGVWSLSTYPMEEKVKRFSDVRSEAAAVVRVYSEGVKNKVMMAYMVLSLAAYSLATSVDAFAAVRMTQELHAKAHAYGDAQAIGSGLTLAAILLLGTVLDKWPLKVSLLLLLGLVMASLLGLGMAESVFWTQVFMITSMVGVGASLAPAMMWLARLAGDVSLSGAFALHKVTAAVMVGVTMALMSVAVPWIGIQWLFIVCAGLGVLVLAGIWRLEEPGRG